MQLDPFSCRCFLTPSVREVYFHLAARLEPGRDLVGGYEVDVPHLAGTERGLVNIGKNVCRVKTPDQ